MTPNAFRMMSSTSKIPIPSTNSITSIARPTALPRTSDFSHVIRGWMKEARNPTGTNATMFPSKFTIAIELFPALLSDGQMVLKGIKLLGPVCWPLNLSLI